MSQDVWIPFFRALINKFVVEIVRNKM
jgi:hypothetical protein